jgi:hypothetical protein
MRVHERFGEQYSTESDVVPSMTLIWLQTEY